MISFSTIVLAPRSAVAALALYAALHGTTAAAQAAPPEASAAQRGAFERAADAFQRGRFAAAYGQFVRLAHGGDTRAAAIASLMHREGRALFRTDWDASLDQQAGWRALAAESVRREVQP